MTGNALWPSYLASAGSARQRTHGRKLWAFLEFGRQRLWHTLQALSACACVVWAARPGCAKMWDFDAGARMFSLRISLSMYRLEHAEQQQSVPWEKLALIFRNETIKSCWLLEWCRFRTLFYFSLAAFTWIWDKNISILNLMLRGLQEVLRV